jgi:hypothetical protein
MIFLLVLVRLSAFSNLLLARLNRLSLLLLGMIISSRLEWAWHEGGLQISFQVKDCEITCASA